MAQTLRSIWALRSFIFIVIAFVAPCPLLIYGFSESESRCAYVILSMAVLWITEAIPISVTALMPIYLLPMLGVQNGKDVSKNYLNDTTTLFLGGLILAVGMEEVNLHRRIAIGITRLLGSRMNTLMFGLMFPTWFLSMWISNTAATAMMLPIVTAVTQQMEKLESGEIGLCLELTSGDNLDDDGEPVKTEHVTLNVDEDNNPRRQKSEEMKRMSKGFALCVAYAANVGGIATLTGTPPNLVLQGQAEEKFADYGGKDSGITYANWLGFGFPLSFLLLFLSWFWLQTVFSRCGCCKGTDKHRKKAIQRAVTKEWIKLGKMKFSEVIVLILFCLLATLWVFRSLPDIGGWGDLFIAVNGKSSTARDSTASIFISSLLFVFPKEIPNVFCWFKNSGSTKPKYQPILTWKVAEQKVSWGVIILLGGGFALADAASKSGLSKMIGCELRVFKDFDPRLVSALVCLIVAACTEITSNTAIASLLMPIMFELALSIDVHPLYLMISAAVSCSFAFMLPVATPPNAIVFSTGFVKIWDMAAVGSVMNIIALLCLTLAINTWGKAIFGLDTVPEIFSTAANSTCPGDLIGNSVGNTTILTTTTVDLMTTSSVDMTTI